MGERKGQNFYYPPDFNYKVHHNLNKYHGTHALRERAKKIKEGILVIRFEMPFNVWCLGCNNHIGMGVRYNAEKKKIGMYYTTPLYEFRMKCHLCSNYFTIRTDPKNFDYEMVEGLRRQEKRFDSGELDNVAPVDRNFDQKLAADAMFKMEHGTDDRRKRDDAESQMARLECIQTRMQDDYSANAALRNLFRREKKILNEVRAADDELKKRLSTEIDLQPASKDDAVMAQQMLKYRNVRDFEEEQEIAKGKALDQPIFSLPSTSAVRRNPSQMSLKDNIKANSVAQLSARVCESRRQTATAISGFMAGSVLKTFGDNSAKRRQSIGILIGSERPDAQRIIIDKSRKRRGEDMSESDSTEPLSRGENFTKKKSALFSLINYESSDDDGA